MIPSALAPLMVFVVWIACLPEQADTERAKRATIKILMLKKPGSHMPNGRCPCQKHICPCLQRRSCLRQYHTSHRSE